MRQGISGISIKGVAACLRPGTRPVNSLCASDLCQIAAERLLCDLAWKPQDIALLVNVTQTPDYSNHPMTAPSIASRIGCGEIMALDVPGGGAGYICGIRVAAALLAAGQFDKALVCAGDALVHTLPEDCDPVTANMTDAGTVTALEKDPSAELLSFYTGTVGAAFFVNSTPGLGFRHTMSPRSLVPRKGIQGGYLRDVDPHIDLAALRKLVLHHVPKVLDCIRPDVQSGSIAQVFFTQVDSELHNHLARDLGVKVPVQDLFDTYGNLESAGLPVSLIQYLRAEPGGVSEKAALVGFGSGFSYGAMTLDLSGLVTPEMKLV
ncbi:hypothetical protein HEQ60_09390 [Haematospirillum sp. H1815]|uniref:3-oxoacyl-[acyl-carrier-protein] synthase III C-terminal domain-containing protein n=1 Tax=Haematospirillum sp. H1815 TaxID=2723108 RepID=UPI00143BAD78|nr:3-oxoacyl-[acyl-carrier-protein] synthase III C-terminal domain-containing protein [Haematospirillum sp. H1815]NKD77970.1 hypothetical protein [Haematospirillum sp. H1815]